MNQEPEASSSSQPFPRNTRTIPLKTLLNECKKVRERVESTKNVKTLIAYSRVICAAFESIEAMINEFKAMYPTWEADEIKAWEYCVNKACEICKETRTKFVNAILVSSSPSNAAGSKKVMIWKKQCDKNIEKIESLVKIACMMDDSTWSVAFVLHGICHGAYRILAVLNSFLMLEESVKVENSKFDAEGFFEMAEMGYRKLILEKVEIMPQGMLRQRGLLDESNEKASVEEEDEDALKEEIELRERLQNEIMAILQNNLQVDEIQKNSLEGEINKKKFHQDEAMKKIQEEEEEEEEALKNSHEKCTQKKLEEEETLKKLQEGEEVALKELQEEDLLKRFQEEIMGMLQKNLQEEETQQNSVEGEINKKELHEDEAIKKILEEEEALKNLHEEHTKKKLQEEENLKKLQEEEAMKKLQEDENQKNSEETEVNKRLQEEKASKKSEEEKNSGDKIVEFSFCGITVRMKNGVIEEVLE